MPTYAWRNQRKLKKFLDRIASLLVKIQTWDIPNTKQECSTLIQDAQSHDRMT
jgi:hypothetical protein